MLAGSGTSVMVDLLLHNGAVNIICAEPLRDLRHAGRHHNPVGLDVRNIVEHQARNGNLFQIVETAGPRQVRKRRVIRMKGKRDKCDEAIGLVLQFA